MRMRVKVTCAALILGASFALSTPATAGQVKVTFGPYQATPGGEFTLDNIDELARFVGTTRPTRRPRLEISLRSRPSVLRRQSISTYNTTYDA